MVNNVKVQKSGIHGKGVFALKSFKIGEEVSRFPRGRFVTKLQVDELSEDDKDHLDVVDENTFEIMAKPARFVNHSCDPNTMEKITNKAIISYAFRPIKKGEEITTDYRIRSNGEWKLKCSCGKGNCQGEIIGNFFSLTKELQKKYLSYAPVFIQKIYQGQSKI